MPRREKKPPRLSGTIKDLPLREYREDDTSVKGGGLKSAATNEIVSPRDPASGLPTGKRT